ncbi:uncharacterized protein An15g05570 [Aspergillus niger]|uniref:Contig An15c0190, genomic contig n=2 Tax=Aspergillus niger TaxID=5061 RepID=A2R5U3_ASPNC|nr:uncharacterized protein An15g05570 [Aspergillus niger]CAK97342.1 unnamed protein product [Aspergillus niger]
MQLDNCGYGAGHVLGSMGSYHGLYLAARDDEVMGIHQMPTHN